MLADFKHMIQLSTGSQLTVSTCPSLRDSSALMAHDTDAAETEDTKKPCVVCSAAASSSKSKKASCTQQRCEPRDASRPPLCNVLRAELELQQTHA